MNPDSRLLHLPQSSRYAVTAMFYLASRTDGAYHMVGEIARINALSPSYLSKILQRLAQHKILDSRRGAKGGYRLGRPAEAISLSEIIAASRRVDGDAMPCMIEARDCDCAAPCAMHEFVAETEEAMLRRLTRTTLAAFKSRLTTRETP
ncbi:MAG: Rrf2 family transcriptional regulator [Elusimicrobia bacterium]|nr:Rrf2 family transcriptional regulator [Elusimicrobiota bacterium]